MRRYLCDECGGEIIGDLDILLRRTSPVTGGIGERHFCTIKCFWLWVGRNRPTRKPNENMQLSDDFSNGRGTTGG